MDPKQLALAAVAAINQKSLPGLEKSKPCVTLRVPPAKGGHGNENWYRMVSARWAMWYRAWVIMTW